MGTVLQANPAHRCSVGFCLPILAAPHQHLCYTVYTQKEKGLPIIPPHVNSSSKFVSWEAAYLLCHRSLPPSSHQLDSWLGLAVPLSVQWTCEASRGFHQTRYHTHQCSPHIHNVQSTFIMSKVAELPQCLLVIYWLSTSFLLLYVQHVSSCYPLYFKV